MQLSLPRALATFLPPLGLTAALPVAKETNALVPIFGEVGLEPVSTHVRRDDCSSVNHVIDKIGTSTEIIAYFSSGYYSTLWVCRRMGGSNCNDAALAISSIFRDGVPSLAGYLESALRAEGEVFDSIDMTHTLQARDDSTQGPIEMASNATLTKRGSGNTPGFKVSYTTRMESKLTHTHHLSNYIVLWKAGHSANFYFRIIPESNNFGMIYESVDVCGGMAGLL
ncbi:hypothetical protein BDV29DRAFT_201131 [Aspergillus leporis]|uniref:Uncharacterized protein n=1 Tax=Aspergillus leporis TaxID=41062 RepID=A0A5N5X6H1_9EURO|nr:hypothetical protein BDV29DRAFT_201131 [Aspergillus leporis]